MSHPTAPVPPPIPSPKGSWFADRPLAVKFGVMVGVVGLAFAGVATTVVAGHSEPRAASEELARLEPAYVLVLQLDARASELEVDGVKALVRLHPTQRLAGLAYDIATPG